MPTPGKPILPTMAALAYFGRWHGAGIPVCPQSGRRGDVGRADHSKSSNGGHMNARQIIESRIEEERHRKLDRRIDVIVVSSMIIMAVIAYVLQRIGVL
jgi:hypothetical protein